MILYGDTRKVLPTITADSVDCVITSPPYLKQRRYGDHPDEIGLEDTVADYVTTIADVFDELRRTLRPTGWAWLNIGDKANNSGGAGGDWAATRKTATLANGGPGRFRDAAYPEASYMDVPGAVIAELLRRGWRLRSQIVWDKGREKPESLRHVRRPRSSHEMIYLLQPQARARRADEPKARFYWSQLTETGTVWHFPPGSSGDPHLAPFPDELARRCLLPTTLPGDVVLDPFSGAGTMHRVALEMGRRPIGVELYDPNQEPTP